MATSKVLGTVTSVVGEVKATASDGTTRILQVGDKVFSDEVITTSANGDVKIALEGAGGRSLECGNDTTLALNEGMLGLGTGIASQDGSPVVPPSVAAQQEMAGPAGKPAGPADVAALQAAIAAGADPSQVAEATAAGGAPGAGGADSGGGHRPVIIEQGNTPGAVTSGFVTQGGSIEFPTPELNELPPVEGTPEVSVSVQVQVQVEVQVELGIEGQPDVTQGPAEGGVFAISASGDAVSLVEGTLEGSLEIPFVITLSQVFDSDVQVTYQIVPGSAENPSDFFDGDLMQTITIPAGESSFVVPIQIVRDHFVEANESFSIVLIDAVNATINPAQNSAMVTIFNDDALPVANPDTNWVQEDAFVGESEAPTASGNALQNQSHPGDPSELLNFADAADTDFEPLTVSAVNGAAGNVGMEVAGTYGTLTLNADGTYIYTLNNSNATVQALTAEQSLVDTFDYSVTDGFNAPDSSTLTITIFGSNDGPEITVQTGEGPFATSAQGTVFEAALAEIGSNPGSNGEFVTGSFKVTDPDGLGDIESVTINGQIVAIANLVGSTFEGDAGLLTITAYSGGVANFTYELEQAVTDGDGAETDVFTLTTSDGDSSSSPATITITIIDDVPSIDVTATAGADALVVDETNLGLNATANFADNFGETSAFGADGAGTLSTTYSLSISGSDVDSGLVDVATGQSVVLTMSGGVVEGRTESGNQLVFTVSVDAGGNVTLDQARAISHPNTTNPDDAVTLDAADLITLTRSSTITDDDGDVVSDSAAIDIGTALSFKDDGPSIDVTATAGADALVVDETNLGLNATANFADNFGETSAFGADGAGTLSTTYSLSISGSDVDSGLVDVATGQSVVLTVSGGVVEGRTESGNQLVFTVSVDAGGNVTLDQARAISHPNTTNPDDAVTLDAADLITLTRSSTITDDDGDVVSDSAAIDIGTALSFKDDGPSIDITAGDTSVAEGGTVNNGAWVRDAGADGGVVKIVFDGNEYNLDEAIVTGKGTLTVNSNGSWTFVALNNLDNDVAQGLSFAVKITDADGDFATDSHTITINDGPGPVGGDTVTLSVDEDDLPAGSDTTPESLTASDATVAFTAGSDDLIAFGFGSTGGISVSGFDNDAPMPTLSWAVESGKLVGRIEGTAAIELSIVSATIAAGATGNITVSATLLSAWPHDAAPDADSLIISGISVVASDHDSESASASLTVTVVDDEPVVTATGGTIENDAGESLVGLLPYDMNADSLGFINLSSPIVTSGGSPVALTSNGSPLVYQVADLDDDGLQELYAYADTDANGVDAGDTLVFTLAPTAPDAADGSYTLTMQDVVDLPIPTIELDFSNITAGGPTMQKAVFTDATETEAVMLISTTDGTANVNANQGFVGYSNNIMNDPESIKYEFGQVNLADFSVAHEDVNDVQLNIFNTGSGSDTFGWTAFKDGAQVGTSSLTFSGDGLTSAIHVDGGYDTLILNVTDGAFKVGGVVFTELGDAQDVNLNIAFNGADNDGDTFNGAIDVTITAGDGTAEQVIQTLLNQNPV